MTFQEVTLLDASQGVGLKGIAPDREPESLAPSHLSWAENVRFDQGVVKVRRGVSPILDTPIPTPGGELVGAALVRDSPATWMALAACYDPALDQTRLWFNQHGTGGGGWGGWIESTAGSGIWGNTRIPGRPPRPVSFAGIPGLYGVAQVAVQSGASGDRARMIRLSLPTQAPLVHPVEPPLAALADSPVAGPEACLNVASGSWTLAGSGLTASLLQASPHQCLQASATGSAPEGSWASFLAPLAAAIDASSSPQVLVMAEVTGGLEGWKSLKLEAASGPGPAWTTLFDPASGMEEIIQTDLCFEEGEADFRVYAFPLGDQAAGHSALRGLRITALHDLPEGFRAAVAMIAASGVVPGGAQYGVSFCCSGTGSESPGVVMLSSELGDGVNQDLLARALLAGAPGLRAASPTRTLPGVMGEWQGKPVTLVIPLDEGLFFRFDVPLCSPSPEEGGRGVDQARVYRRDPGEAAFSLVTDWPLARWNGSAWQPGAFYGPGVGLTQWGERALAPDRVPRHLKDFSTRMPDGGCTSLPPGSAVLFANGRLYAASPEGSAQGLRGAVWISDRDQPLRFRETPLFDQGVLDEARGGVAVLGPEPVTALVEQPSSLLGLGEVYAFTQDSLYRIEGLRGVKALEEGCSSPGAAGSSSLGLFWLSSRRQSCLLGSSWKELSRGWTGGQWESLTGDQLAWAAGQVHQGQLVLTLPYGPGGRRTWVRDLHEDRWESVDELPSSLTPRFWTVWRGGGEEAPAYWTSSGRLIRWEDPQAEDDGGEAISFLLRSRALAAPPGGFLRLRRIGIAGAGGTGALAARRIFQGPASQAAGTITLEPHRTHRFDTGPEGQPVGGRGEKAQIELEGTASSGWSLSRWTVEAQALTLGSREAG